MYNAHNYYKLRKEQINTLKFNKKIIIVKNIKSINFFNINGSGNTVNCLKVGFSQRKSIQFIEHKI